MEANELSQFKNEPQDGVIPAALLLEPGWDIPKLSVEDFREIMSSWHDENVTGVPAKVYGVARIARTYYPHPQPAVLSARDRNWVGMVIAQTLTRTGGEHTW